MILLTGETFWSAGNRFSVLRIKDRVFSITFFHFQIRKECAIINKLIRGNGTAYRLPGAVIIKTPVIIKQQEEKNAEQKKESARPHRS